VTFELGKGFERSAFAPFGGFDPGLGGAPQGVQSRSIFCLRLLDETQTFRPDLARGVNSGQTGRDRG